MVFKSLLPFKLDKLFEEFLNAGNDLGNEISENIPERYNREDCRNIIDDGVSNQEKLLLISRPFAGLFHAPSRTVD